MEDVSSVLRLGVERFLELSALKEREAESKLSALAVRKEAEAKEAAAKQNKLSVDLEKQRGQNELLCAENEKMKRVNPRTTSYLLL